MINTKRLKSKRFTWQARQRERLAKCHANGASFWVPNCSTSMKQHECMRMHEVRGQDSHLRVNIHHSRAVAHGHKLGTNLSGVNNPEIITHTHTHTHTHTQTHCGHDLSTDFGNAAVCVLANCMTRCYKCIQRNVNMLLLKWCSVRRELRRCAVLIKGLDQIWILYTLYMWHYFRGVKVRNLISGKEKAERVGVKQSIPATAQPLTFLTPAHLPPTLKPPGMALSS